MAGVLLFCFWVATITHTHTHIIYIIYTYTCAYTYIHIHIRICADKLYMQIKHALEYNIGGSKKQKRPWKAVNARWMGREWRGGAAGGTDRQLKQAEGNPESLDNPRKVSRDVLCVCGQKGPPPGTDTQCGGVKPHPDLIKSSLQYSIPDRRLQSLDFKSLPCWWPSATVSLSGLIHAPVACSETLLMWRALWCLHGWNRQSRESTSWPEASK